jgi:hypothetical protein
MERTFENERPCRHLNFLERLENVAVAHADIGQTGVAVAESGIRNVIDRQHHTRMFIEAEAQ